MAANTQEQNQVILDLKTLHLSLFANCLKEQQSYLAYCNNFKLFERNESMALDIKIRFVSFVQF